MTKAETIMLVIVIAFIALLVLGMRLIRTGALETMTFWTAGVMGIMVIFGLIAVFGFNSAE